MGVDWKTVWKWSRESEALVHYTHFDIVLCVPITSF